MDYLKQMLRSKTVWAGIAQVVAALGMYATGDQSLHELLLGGSGVVMILLRLVTTDSIDNK